MTPSQREVELKYRLAGRDDYENLCRALGEPADQTLQVNHYFGSPDGRVPGDRGMVRIRVEQGRAAFTVKLGGPLRKGLASSMEYEDPWVGPIEEIPALTGESIRQGGGHGMEALDAASSGPCTLVWSGSMENRRRVYVLPSGLRVEVDASRYASGVEDFEVELETADPDRDRPRLEALLAEAGVRSEPQRETKYQRFLRCQSRITGSSG